MFSPSLETFLGCGITLISRVVRRTQGTEKANIFCSEGLERRVSWFLSSPLLLLVRILIRCACFRVAPHFPSTTLVWQDLFFSLPYPEPGLLKILKYSPFFLPSFPFSPFLSFSPSFHGGSSEGSSRFLCLFVALRSPEGVRLPPATISLNL